MHGYDIPLLCLLVYRKKQGIRPLDGLYCRIGVGEHLDYFLPHASRIDMDGNYSSVLWFEFSVM